MFVYGSNYRRRIALFQYIVYHPLQTHFTAIIRCINAGNAIFMKRLYFIGKYYAATATKYFNMPAPAFFK